MPVPDFNANGVLPPHLGQPTEMAQISPFPATALELCQKLSFSPERREVLRGWLALRNLLRTAGFLGGFQWLDGSFMEDAEAVRGRAPADIDVVSFLPMSPGPLDPAISQKLANRGLVKSQMKVDHMVVFLNWSGPVIVEYTRYWCGLFSHRRGDGVWKGMLKVDLNTPSEDVAAGQHLDSLE